MKNLSPKQEPVGWSVLVGLIVAALISYNIPITNELADALTVAVPLLVAAVVARANVTPVSKT